MAKKTAPKKRDRKKAGAPHVPRKPRQKALPGMEDHGIKDIENAAHDYADARDERMRLTEVEAKRHVKLVAVMKKHGKKTYRHRTGDEIITINIVAKDPEDRAKVKIVPATEANIEQQAKADAAPDAADEPGVE